MSNDDQSNGTMNGIESLFHPAVAAWFGATFNVPTDCQRRAWPAIRGGRHTLIAAPTGSGKTLAAFLAAIDDLVRQGEQRGSLVDRTEVLYVSPLKALSNDIDRNLQQPLAGIRAELAARGGTEFALRSAVRTGDTPAAERARMRRTPPHILVTTPESLYILLTSESGRAMLSTVRTVIIDEIHAVAGSKRGAHLALSLQRLEALTAVSPVRIGLSATQRPIERVAAYLTGRAEVDCNIVDTGHQRARDLAIELPRSPLTAVMAGEVWSEVYDRLAELVSAHRTTLVFVNTRRLAERIARQLAERLGEAQVAAHHGSLAKEHRLAAEQRLKAGALRVLVATASMELGIDIGDVDLVCQIGSPRSIAAFLQRVGRSGHAVGALPKGRLLPVSRDDLVECTALLAALGRGELDTLRIPEQPLDVLAQQIVAEVACREWCLDELYDLVRRAWSYRALARDQFDAVVEMLADGFSTRRGRRGAYLHLDAVNGRLRGRRAARLTALTNGGAIPEQFDYDVLLEPDGFKVGTLNEDFAFESLAGDIFQLGNTSYRILRVERGVVRVADAKGQPPNIPFWFGEAPGRSDELSLAVSGLRTALSEQLARGVDQAADWLVTTHALAPAAARQLADYLGAAQAALGVLPSQTRIVFERFFDEAGDMHLVIHSPYGARLNRAWGLALRKRFCRRFNFELQAAALEDSIVLSLGATHSFPLDEIKHYLSAETVRAVLIQALLDAPMFPTHWRWVANIALAVRRNRNGKRIAPALQRADAEDLVAVVFPDQLACQENLTGEREVPDHPLVNQAIADCLHDVMDVAGVERLLRRLAAGEVEVVVRDLNAPSPLAQEILGARPYAFLDDAPAEERRTIAVQSRGMLAVDDAADLARLDPAAIERVREEAWPELRERDELHDALVVLGFMTGPELSAAIVQPWLNALQVERRATRVNISATHRVWVAAERLAQMRAVFPRAGIEPAIIAVGASARRDWSAAEALVELLRSRLEGLGPVTARRLATDLDVELAAIDAALLALQNEGFAIQGHFSTIDGPVEWCDRRLLARIHRYTMGRLRREIEPVSATDYTCFLHAWQRATPPTQGDGVEALAAVIEQLQGFEIPVAAWESAILPARIRAYTPSLLDELALAGRVRWLRLTPPRGGGDGMRSRAAGPVRNTPVTLLPRRAAALWRDHAPALELDSLTLSSPARAVADVLAEQGALFFDEITEYVRLLPSQLEQALAELVAQGVVTSDGFNGLRGLLLPNARRAPRHGRLGKRRHPVLAVEAAGRWSLVRPQHAAQPGEDCEPLALALLQRYGVVLRAILTREADWLPPWRDLLRAFRRLEAQGRIRGGRFVAGFTGEQFALPEAVGALRQARNKTPAGAFTLINAADPLNLVGIIDPGERVPALATNRVLYRDGVCVAVQLGDQVKLRGVVDGLNEWQARNALLRGGAAPSLRSGEWLARVS